MRLLLHICCAPCVIYPLQRLNEQGIDVVGYFYNPNIHSFGEYKNRLQAVVDFSKEAKLKVDLPEYIPQEYFRSVNMFEQAPKRCSLCWELRLTRTAKEAKAGGFQEFSTTLLVSPYQDQEALREIGNVCGRKEGVVFHYEDYRLGFRKAHDEAKAKGIYCQKYCGCVYSEVERNKKPR